MTPFEPTVRPIAGGTALMLMMKAGVFRPAKLVSLRGIEPKYSGNAATSEGLRVGAMTTLSALEDFFTGYYETVLEKNELIAEVHIPAQGARRAAYKPRVMSRTPLSSAGKFVRSGSMPIGTACRKWCLVSY